MWHCAGLRPGPERRGGHRAPPHPVRLGGQSDCPCSRTQTRGLCGHGLRDEGGLGTSLLPVEDWADRNVSILCPSRSSRATPARPPRSAYPGPCSPEAPGGVGGPRSVLESAAKGRDSRSWGESLEKRISRLLEVGGGTALPGEGRPSRFPALTGAGAGASRCGDLAGSGRQGAPGVCR